MILENTKDLRGNFHLGNPILLIDFFENVIGNQNLENNIILFSYFFIVLSFPLTNIKFFGWIFVIMRVNCFASLYPYYRCVRLYRLRDIFFDLIRRYCNIQMFMVPNCACRISFLCVSYRIPEFSSYYYDGRWGFPYYKCDGSCGTV